MAILITCPHCNARIQILPEHGGRQLPCPHCKGTFIAPAVASPVRADMPARSRPAAPVLPAIIEPSEAPDQQEAPDSGMPAYLSDLASQGRKMVQGFAKRKPGKRSKAHPFANNKLLLLLGGGFGFLVLCCGVLSLLGPGNNIQKPSPPTTLQGAKSYVVGTWRWHEDLEEVKFDESISFREDGTYEKKGWDNATIVGRDNGVRVESVGNWKIEQDGRKYSLKLDPKSGSPELGEYGAFSIEDGVLRCKSGNIYQKLK